MYLKMTEISAAQRWCWSRKQLKCWKRVNLYHNNPASNHGPRTLTAFVFQGDLEQTITHYLSKTLPFPSNNNQRGYFGTRHLSLLVFSLQFSSGFLNYPPAPMCPRAAQPAIGCRQIQEGAQELCAHGSGGTSLQTSNPIQLPQPLHRLVQLSRGHTSVLRKKEETFCHPTWRQLDMSVLLFPSSYLSWKREPPEFHLAGRAQLSCSIVKTILWAALDTSGSLQKNQAEMARKQHSTGKKYCSLWIFFLHLELSKQQ